MTSFQDAPDEAMEMTKQWRLVLQNRKMRLHNGIRANFCVQRAHEYLLLFLAVSPNFFKN